MHSEKCGNLNGQNLANQKESINVKRRKSQPPPKLRGKNSDIVKLRIENGIQNAISKSKVLNILQKIAECKKQR